MGQFGSQQANLSSYLVSFSSQPVSLCGCLVSFSSYLIACVLSACSVTSALGKGFVNLTHRITCLIFLALQTEMLLLMVNVHCSLLKNSL